MYGFVITTAGEGMLARASAGEGLTITEVWVGKGAVESAGAAKALTALLDPVAKATSTTPAVAGGQISMLVEYRNDMGGGLEEGFTLSEFGVMAKVGDDAPALLYYAALGDRAQPVPPIAEGLDVHRFPVAVGVTGEVAVSLEYPAGVWVTHEELEEALAGIDLSGYVKTSEKGKSGGVATLGADGKVPAGQLPKMDYDPSGSAAAVQKNLTAHTGDKNNPHAVTAEQVGASRAVKGTYPVAAGQTIAAGDVVDVVEGQLQKTVTAVPNVNTVINKTAYAELQMVHLSKDINVQIYMSSSGGTMYANILDDNGGVVLKGENLGMDMENIAAARLDDTHVLVGFVLYNQFEVMVGTVSGKTISFGDSVEVDGAFDRYYAFAALPNGRVAIVYKAVIAGSSKLRVRVYTLSSSSLGSIYTRDVTGESQIYISATAIGEERVCICFADQNDSSKGKAVVAAINGSNAVTWGEVVTFENDSFSDLSCAARDSDGLILLCETAGGQPKVRSIQITEAGIGTVSGAVLLRMNPSVLVPVGNDFAAVSTNGRAKIVSISGRTPVPTDEYFTFSPNDTSPISAVCISDSKILAAYADIGNSKYGTVTTLTVSGNQIAGDFVVGSQDAIALQSGTEGQNIEVIYSGTVAADWVTEGQVISSPGVYGAGVLDGVLQVWSKDRPGQVVTGRYTGDGTASRHITLGFSPSAVYVQPENGITFSKDEDILYGGLVVQGESLGTAESPALSIDSDGFIVYYDNKGDPYRAHTNAQPFLSTGGQYFYVAWR